MKKRGTRVFARLPTLTPLSQKHSQITIFIIVAILLIAVIFLIFYLRGGFGGKDVIDVRIVPINNFVLDCLEETSNNAIKDVGEKGGYAFITDDVDSVEQIPHYLAGERKLMPSIETIESEISFIVMNELSYCILNFKDFDNEYEDIRHELKNVETSILDDVVRIKLDYPIRVKIDESSSEISDFSFDIKIRLDDYYDAAEKIIVEQQEHIGSICLSCIYDLGEEYDVNIDMYDYGNSTVFTIIDDEYKINDEAYEWGFAIK